MFRSLHLLIPLAVLAAAVALTVTDPGGVVTDTRLRVFDAYQRLAPRVYEPVPVKYVDIDDESLETHGQWPWPRTVIADLIARLHQAGASVIAFDMVFAEPDRTSPTQIAAALEATPKAADVREALAALPDHDALLADQMADAGNVVTGFVLGGGPDGTPHRPYGLIHQGDDPHPFLPRFTGSIVNLDQLEAAAAGNGAFNFRPDRDTIVRRVPLMVVMDDTLYATLVPETLRVASGGTTYQVKTSDASGETALGEDSGINHIRIGPGASITMPTTAHGEMWMHYTLPAPDRRLPAWRVMTDDFDPALVKDHIIFIGTAAAGLRDLRATPLSPAIAGVEIHAQAAEQILLGHFLERPDWAFGAELTFMILLGVLLIALMNRLGALLCAALAAVAIGGAIYGSWMLFRNDLLLIDPVTPAFAVLLVYLASSLVNFRRTEHQRQQIRSAFGHYLSPVLVEQLAREPARLRLGGETRRITVLFADIRGFTALSEDFRDDPQALTRLMNQFLTPMTKAVLDHGGTVDKYMGDCVMAFWNAPLDDPGHARHACQAAVAMLSALETFNENLAQARSEAGLTPTALEIGIGLNTGDCVVGNLGSDQRFDYSVLGDAVNLASRLEGQSKTYGVPIVLGEETRKGVADLEPLELDVLAVRGREQPVRIFTLPSDNLREHDEAFQRLILSHNAMLDSYRARNWDRALHHLDRAAKLGPELKNLYMLYRQRIGEYRSHPPPEGWTGVFSTLTTP